MSSIVIARSIAAQSDASGRSKLEEITPHPSYTWRQHGLLTTFAIRLQ
jgi:hypothetical protein